MAARRGTVPIVGLMVVLVILALAATPTALLAAGPQPDPCALFAGYVPPEGARAADAGQPTTVDGGETTSCTFISDFPDSFGTAEVLTISVSVTRYKPGSGRTDSVSRAREFLGYQASQEGLGSAAYGDLGYQGMQSGGGFSVFHVYFTVFNYWGVVASNASISSIAEAEARKLEAVMKAAIGPPDDATAGQTAPGAFQLGIGCAEDGDVLRCTASPTGAPAGADIVYAWTIDGVAQAAAGARLEVALSAGGIAAGDHQIAVTGRDSVSGLSATASQTMRTTGGGPSGAGSGGDADIPIIPIGVGAGLLAIAALAANAARKGMKGSQPARPVASAPSDAEVADGLAGMVLEGAADASGIGGPTDAQIKDGAMELLEQVPAAPASTGTEPASQPRADSDIPGSAPTDPGPAIAPSAQADPSGASAADADASLDAEALLAEAVGELPPSSGIKTAFENVPASPAGPDPVIHGAVGSDRSGGYEGSNVYGEGAGSAAPAASGAYEAQVVGQGSQSPADEPLAKDSNQEQLERDTEREDESEREGR